MLIFLFIHGGAESMVREPMVVTALGKGDEA